MHVPTPNLEGQETVFVGPLPMDQPGMRNCVARTPPSIAQWVAEVHKPPHHGKVESLRCQWRSCCHQNRNVQMASDKNLVGLEYADDIVPIFEEKPQVFLNELTKAFCTHKV
ncbi:hypothetical protein T265_01829 [Opisthorchis viverrini]|uniref:Uncharacterized protein n=1 Tax=Opisthorchis viverrini TaxID=6198 RepID=A0A075A1B8_OPIVI|nr:hypothetical protein T265_01829 [Opisthorchis viverrini]KER32052.1 hypothetical protein T265_01829 [Opisthorchis viverrini]